MNAESILPMLGELLAKSGLLILGAAALAMAGRRLSAAQQHVLWLALFGALSVLPFTKLFAPHWALHRPVPTPRVTMVPVAPALIAPVAPVTGATPAPIETVRAHTWPKPLDLILPAWLVGAILVVAYRLVGCLRLSRLKLRRTDGASARIVAFARIVAAELDLRRPYEIRIAHAVCIPCTWGIWKPIVLLPRAAEQWSEARLMAALRHELAHVRRRDYLVRWVALAACAFYWPNPLVWFAARRLSAAQERACDDLVLRAGTAPTDYATLLMETASSALRFGPGLHAALAMARPSTLEARILAVVDERRNRLPVGRTAILGAAIGVIVVVGVSALAQIAPETKAPIVATAGEPKSQFLLSAKVLEIPKGGPLLFDPAGLPLSVTGQDNPTEGGQLMGVFTEEQAATVLQKFVGDKTVNFLAQPKLAVAPGQPVTLQIGHEYDLPAGSALPRKFIGTSLDLKAMAGPDSTIDLDLTVQRTTLDQPETAVAGHPVFREKRVRTEVSIWDASTVMVRLGPSPKEGRELFVLIEAEQMDPADGLATPAASESKPPVPQIEVEAKFVELPPDWSGEGAANLKSFTTLSDPQWQVIFRELSQRKGVEILSSPRVTAKPKQRAVIEIIHEFHYPTEWEKDAAGWKPSAFETKNVGVAMDVSPDLKAGGAIELRVKPSIVQFLGFADLDSGKAIPAKGDGSKYGDARFTRDMPEMPDSLLRDRLKAIFSDRELEKTVTLKSGETAALGTLAEVADVKPFEQFAPKRKVLIFVSARTLELPPKRVRLKRAPDDAVNPSNGGDGPSTPIRINDQ